MKKTFTLLSMLLCFFAGVHAQTSTAVKHAKVECTPFDQLTTGDYAILIASDKSCTGGAVDYPRFLSGSGTNIPQVDASTSTNDCRTIDVPSRYIWTVTVNDDNTISIQLKDGNYIPVPNANGQGGGNLSATGARLTRMAVAAPNSDWCILKATTTNNVTTYLCANGSKGSSTNPLQYWNFGSTTATNIAKFKFFPIDETYNSSEMISLTYNYTLNGVTKATLNMGYAFVGDKYPNPIVALPIPDFVTPGTVPAEDVTSGGSSMTCNLACDCSNYPFPFSYEESDEAKWGYLSANISTNARCFLTDGTYIAHTGTNGKDAPTSLNAVANDLWRFVGNPFDGFKIMNKNGKSLVYNASTKKTTLSDGTTNNLWKVFGGDIISDAGNITDENASELKTKAFVIRNSTLGEGDNYLDGGGISTKTELSIWQKKSNGSCFLFWEPEFTVALNTTDNLDASYATLCMPVDFKVTTEGVKAYTGKYSEGTLSMTAVEGGVAANQGVVLRSADKNVTTVTLTANAGTTTTSDNDLQGTTSEIAFTDLSDKLVFGVSSSNKVGFFSASGSAALPANRAYLNKSLVGGGTEGAAIMMNFDGKYTGIDAIEGVKAVTNAPIYDFTGRRVVRTVKGGLYIQGGKKFIAQ